MPLYRPADSPSVSKHKSLGWWAVRFLGVLVVIAASIATCSRLAADPDVPIRGPMSETFEALRVLAPIAYRGGPLTGDSDAKQVSRALSTLADGASALERHAVSRDPGFAYLARGLSDLARTASLLVAAGREEAGRRIVRRLVDQCVACHTRVSTLPTSQLGEELLAEIDIESLSLADRAHLEIATRQFEQALTTYERLLGSEALAGAGTPSPELVRYLAVSLSEVGDRARASSTLVALRDGPDVNPELRADFAAWSSSIGELDRERFQGPGLARARALLERSQDVAARTSWRRALVFDLEARLELQRFLEGQSDLSLEVAEAYYHMGVVEERIWDRPWISNAAPFLEESIRLAPGQPSARDAYERLERIWVLGYTGSAGTTLPPDVQQRLRELDEAIRRAARS
jgi:hypothetical protein